MNWNLIKSFPAYICTTKNSIRIANSLEEIKKAEIDDINIIYGIDGSTSEGEKLILEKASEYGMATKRFIRYGEIALAIAFYEAFVEFLKTSHSHMLWFEDDIILHYNAELIYETLKNFKNWKDYNLIYLGTSIVHGREFALSYLKDKNYWADCTNQVVWGTQSLLIDRKAAQALIDSRIEQTQIDMHIVNAAKKNNIIKTAGLLHPLLLKDNKNYDWESIYTTTDPRPWVHGNPPIEEWKEIDTKVLGLYKRSFGINHTSWGLFFQKNVPSVLRTQTRYESIKTILPQ
jgi:GR25 family glycosyltransferase involved in LPS biosynthesis